MTVIECPEVSAPGVPITSKQKVEALVSQAWLVAVTVLTALIIANPNVLFLMDFVG